MNDQRTLFLNLGSNIDPEKNLAAAAQALRKYGDIVNYSSVWESEAVGGNGPNYLNVCIQIETQYGADYFKEYIIRPLEKDLGRIRKNDKYAPRTIDIDIVIENDVLLDNEIWELAFITIPLSEIYPSLMDPKSGEFLIETAAKLKERIWLNKRPDVILD